MDLMLPLYDHSFNGTAFAKMLREMHSIKYAETANAYLNLAKQHMEPNTLTPVSAENVADFGSFFDFFGWSGRVLSGNYVNDMYKKCVGMNRAYYDADMKKRGTGNRVKIDTSYKLPKRLHKKGGISNFSGLVTLTNEHSEIRSQFLIITDAHEQLEAQLKSLVHTLEQYNQRRPLLLHTDNPARDGSLARRVFKGSLLEPCRQPGATVGGDPSRSVSSLPRLEVERERIQFLASTGDAFEGSIYALKELLEDNWPHGKAVPIGLDGEWVVDGTMRFDLLQLAYRLKPGDEIHVIVIPMHVHRSMPTSLLDWLNSSRYSCSA
jgi:hypothetical protein